MNTLRFNVNLDVFDVEAVFVRGREVAVVLGHKGRLKSRYENVRTKNFGKACAEVGNRVPGRNYKLAPKIELVRPRVDVRRITQPCISLRRAETKPVVLAPWRIPGPVSLDDHVDRADSPLRL